MSNQIAYRPFSRSAFSLLDLVIVVGVVFLLAAIFLPALNLARQKTQSERCLNNLHQLTTAWLMYASVNNDRCVNNFGIGSIQSAGTGSNYLTWCPQLLDWTTDSENTNLTLLRLGLLGPYLGADLTLFKCPADTYLSPEQIAAGFPARVRSYSMSGFFGLFSTGAQGVDSTYQGRNYYDNNYRQYLKISDVTQPASIYLFLEQNPFNSTGGYFDVGSIPTTWGATTHGTFGDIPATFHHGGTSFSFADGHAEIHQWQDNVLPSATAPPSPLSLGSINDKPPYNDIHWMWEHSSVPF